MTKRTIRYFRGTEQLTDVHAWSVKRAEALGEIPKRRMYRDFVSVGKNSAGDHVIVDRTILYSLKPSMHKCDARCMNARGHNCECSCGGANHGINR